MMLVQDVMTTDVVTADVDTPLVALIDDMLRHGISGLPVIDANRGVVGVVTEADLVARRGQEPRPRRLLSIVDDALRARQNRWRQKADGLLTAAVMTTPAHTIGPTATVRQAAARMVTLAIKRLPVVDGDGRLAGIISQRDILRLMHRPDGEVDLAVRAALDELEADDVRATTVDGVVTLSGSTPTSGDVERIARRIGELPGVIELRDQLSARGPGLALGLARERAGARIGTDGPTTKAVAIASSGHDR
jgi:CBS-domain-containing membrane protein